MLSAGPAGRLPEIDLALCHGLHVISFMTDRGNPAWTLFDNRGGQCRWIRVSGGRLPVGGRQGLRPSGAEGAGLSQNALRHADRAAFGQSSTRLSSPRLDRRSPHRSITYKLMRNDATAVIAGAVWLPLST